jgi:signal peptidase I
MPANNGKQGMIAILMARKMLNLGTWITTCGDSMYPIIPRGSKVYIKSGSEGIKKGDIVVFGAEGNLLIHRVVKIFIENSSVYYQTKGDNVFYLDPVISKSNIMGSVEKIWSPLNGRIIFVRHGMVPVRVIAGISCLEGKIHRLTQGRNFIIKPMLSCMKYVLKSVIWICSYVVVMKLRLKSAKYEKRQSIIKIKGV